MALKLLINSLFRGGAEKQFAALSARLPADAVLLLENEIALPADRSRLSALSAHTATTSAVVKTLSIPAYARALSALAGPGDTVLSFMERANIVNVLAAGRSGHRAVICERTRPSGEFSGLRGALMRPLIRRYYRRAALVVANSEGVRRDLAENFSVPPEKLRVVRNGYDTTAIAAQARVPLEPAWARVFERPALVTSGRLTPAKGQWHLLRIFREVKRAVPEAALVLVGDGELKGYLEGLAAGLGLKVFSAPGTPPPDEDVYFAGFRENPHNFTAAARLFVFTSLWEGFPNALVEALACGAPVMAADCDSGPREILAPGTSLGSRGPERARYGVLMPALSGRRPPETVPPEPMEAAWADAIQTLLKDGKALEDYARTGTARAADFSLDKAAALWKELLTT
jgi:glycosyltransferase involved in cell wall biosynthesis